MTAAAPLRLRHGTFRAAYPEGEEHYVDGYLFGPFGLNRNRGGFWQITHLKTGRALLRPHAMSPSLLQTRRLVGRIVGACDWNKVTVRNARKVPSWVRELCGGANG